MHNILKSLLFLSFIFVQCTHSTNNSEQDYTKPIEQELAVEDVFNNTEDQSTTETSTLSKTCIKLKKEYEELIHKINKNKNDKILLAELGKWTKDSNHLYCTDTYRMYNDFVEELNNSL